MLHKNKEWRWQNNEKLSNFANHPKLQQIYLVDRYRRANKQLIQFIELQNKVQIWMSSQTF